MLANTVGEVTSIKGEKPNESNIGNRIILPGGVLMEYAPSAWFEATSALKYYNNIKATLFYNSDRAYAEAVDFAWYRTVRILYPDITPMYKVKSSYDKWVISENRNLKGSKGKGLIDGTKAAVDAFLNK